MLNRPDEAMNNCIIGKEHCECFQKLTPEEVEEMDNHMVSLSFNRGDMLLKHGTFASHVMYLKEGLVKVYLEGPAGELVLKIIAPGNLIGISSAYEGNSLFQYSAKAYVDSKVDCIEINHFRKLLKQNAAFGAEVINVLSVNSIQIYNRFYCLVNKRSYGKLADVLLCLSDRVYKSKAFMFQLTRRELGELCGMSTESIVRLMKEFKKDDLIIEEDGLLEIINEEKLRSISNTG
jgi:CRP/FNR family transcriptional regulator